MMKKKNLLTDVPNIDENHFQAQSGNYKPSVGHSKIFDFVFSEHDAFDQQALSEILSFPSESSVFLGILAKCSISGCDVHFLDFDKRITRHVRSDEALQGVLAQGRYAITVAPTNVVAVVVFSKHLAWLYESGHQEVFMSLD